MTFKLRSTIILITALLISGCDREDDVRPGPGVTIEGKTYLTVAIGTQTWTSSNYAGPGGVSYDGNNSKPAYGKYYSRAELDDITLPEGWRIPSQEDYEKLAEFYGVTLPSTLSNTEQIKSFISKTNWNNVAGTNASGFNAYPAGYIFRESLPIDGDIAEFWTSEGVTFSIQEAGANLASLRALFYQSDDSPEYKFNVRFVKG